jgi:hypothetical protein
MARERAAVELTNLLKSPDAREGVARRLMSWFSELRFESLVTNALLIPLRLYRETGQIYPSSDQWELALPFPSLLSETMIHDFATDSPWIPVSALHSGTAPSDFKIDEYFETYNSSFVPPIFDIHAAKIDLGKHRSFRRQWAYEWESVRRRAGLGHSEPPHYFLSPGARDSVTVFDTLQSEAFRSGFLRALAWAVEQSLLTRDAAELLALESCPLDLGLWSVVSEAPPAWWPHYSVEREGLDTCSARILEQVRRLWQKACCERGKRLIYAAGRAATGTDSIYALEIRGFFQFFVGGEGPELGEVADFLRRNAGTLTVEPSLAMEGGLEKIDPRRHATELEGWGLLKAVFFATPWVTPRWQASRMWSNCPTLAPYLSDDA